MDALFLPSRYASQVMTMLRQATEQIVKSKIFSQERIDEIIEKVNRTIGPTRDE
jgi:hypothetical protein